ncbi:hypothetical protein ACIBJF_51980 [Streptomyces sp. NPDC050743]|uniref:hypothetical protein n=1 Tax=Streptomyces sp. NPDC050743 TaxID=3365634 RepID=UPI00378E7148
MLSADDLQRLAVVRERPWAAVRMRSVSGARFQGSSLTSVCKVGWLALSTAM